MTLPNEKIVGEFNLLGDSKNLSPLIEGILIEIYRIKGLSYKNFDLYSSLPDGRQGFQYWRDMKMAKQMEKVFEKSQE